MYGKPPVPSENASRKPGGGESCGTLIQRPSGQPHAMATAQRWSRKQYKPASTKNIDFDEFSA